MKKCSNCGFVPIYVTDECPKCGGKTEDIKKTYGHISFRGAGFAKNDLKK